MSFLLKIVLVAAGLFWASAPGIYAQTAYPAAAASCSITHGGNTLTWTRVANVARLRLPARIGTAKLPLKYSVYTVDAATLHTFLKTAKGSKNAEIALPVAATAGCITFNLAASGTMSAELAAKYPELASMKGTGVEDKSASLRLDYDGKELHAEVLFKGAYYLIAPWKKGTRVYYLVYKKENSGIKRTSITGK